MSIYTQPRSPEYRYTLYNRFDEPIRPFNEIVGGSVQIVAQAQLGGSAQFQIREIGEDVDWLNDRVLVTYDPGVEGFDAWHIGYFLLSSPKENYDAGGVVYDVTGLPTTQIIDQHAPEPWFAVGEGVNIVDEVVSLIDGMVPVAVTESALTMKSSKMFTPEMSTLDIINELLEAAGYWSLKADGTGRLQIRPYLLPKDRPVAIVFDENDDALHSVEWQRFQDLSNIPNMFWVIGLGSDSDAAGVGVAINDDPDSPYSTVNRVPNRHVEEGFDGASQKVFDDRAAQKLAEAMSPVGRIEVSHLPVPITINDVVHFRAQGVDVRATVQKLTYTLDKGALVEAEWREIHV